MPCVLQAAFIEAGRRWVYKIQGTPTLQLYVAKVDKSVNMISYRRFAAYGFILASWGALNTASPVAQDSAGYDITARTAGTLDNEKPSNLSAPR